MAFCLMLVFGYNEPKLQRKRIKLNNKLGGQFVGYLRVPDKSLSLWEQVRDLKKQAAKLCPSDKSYVDILLYIGNTQLYTWFSDFEQLEAIQHATTMQMMWDSKVYIPIPYY